MLTVGGVKDKRHVIDGADMKFVRKSDQSMPHDIFDVFDQQMSIHRKDII